MLAATAAAAVLFATACGGTPASASAPSTPAAAPSSAQPSPDVDPACAMPELDKFLGEVDAYSKRGAFKVGARPCFISGAVWLIPLEGRDRVSRGLVR